MLLTHPWLLRDLPGANSWNTTPSQCPGCSGKARPRPSPRLQLRWAHIHLGLKDVEEKTVYSNIPGLTPDPSCGRFPPFLGGARVWKDPTGSGVGKPRVPTPPLPVISCAPLSTSL